LDCGRSDLAPPLFNSVNPSPPDVFGTGILDPCFLAFFFSVFTTFFFTFPPCASFKINFAVCAFFGLPPPSSPFGDPLAFAPALLVCRALFPCLMFASVDFSAELFVAFLLVF